MTVLNKATASIGQGASSGVGGPAEPADDISQRLLLHFCSLNSAFFLRTDWASDSPATPRERAFKNSRGKAQDLDGESTMGSWLNSVRSFDAKRHWGDREWRIYDDLPWAVKRVADVLIRIPRFSSLARPGEIEKTDRRIQLVERKLSEAKLRPVEKG
jgi:hypothetical protein